MFEPITMLAGFLTMWAQLNNYGIDSEDPQLKNIRVRREIKPYHQENTVYNPKTDLEGSIIMKNIYAARSKRQSNANDVQNDYVTTVIPLANYPPGSDYYSQNTNGIPYYYNGYNGNNKVFVNNGNNNGYNSNNNGYNTANNGIGTQGATSNGQIKYRTNEISSKLVYNPYGSNKNQGTGSNSNNNNGLNNGNNKGLNNGNNNRKRVNNVYNGTVIISSFIGSSWCPEFLQSVTIGGTKACVNKDDYDY